jgi:predicted DCC family thiol-disulfide oxidoreductase YuxK
MPTDLLFYDGSCGLCHRSVQFAVARDREGSLFRYAPLGGPTYQAAFPADVRDQLPDSIVLRTADGRTLIRSAAILHIAERIGGLWGAAARAVSMVPRWFLDLCYNGVARVRYRLFTRPGTACPLLPAELRQRFLP